MEFNLARDEPGRGRRGARRRRLAWRARNLRLVGVHQQRACRRMMVFSSTMTVDHVLGARQVVHHVEQDAFDDGAQAARTGLRLIALGRST